jgi:hypothetical protein
MSRLSAIASRAARAFSLRSILIGVICLSVGGGLAKAAPPIDIFQLADGTNTTQLAKVDAAGDLAVSVSNLPTTQNVAGTVTVSNGTVAVSNLPTTQNVAGAVAVSNFPATQQVAGSVGDARVTTQIARDELTLDAGGIAGSDTKHTARYTQARVTAFSAVSCATPVTVRVLSEAFITPTSFSLFKLGEGTTCGGDASPYNAVFDVPGTGLNFVVSGPAGATVVIVTWAR